MNTNAPKINPHNPSNVKAFVAHTIRELVEFEKWHNDNLRRAPELYDAPMPLDSWEEEFDYWRAQRDWNLASLSPR
jgi:hypothetical protein